ncbi:MAG: hypothetical protein ACFUZC_07950 [Chthoniobacteraceae bacterium]
MPPLILQFRCPDADSEGVWLLFLRRRAKYQNSRSGVAIIIVLVFVVMLAGLIVTFTSRALNKRLVSNSSANSTKVELFAMGAAARILGDLKQEIVLGSTSVTVTTGSISTVLYQPLSPTNAVPSLVGSSGSGGLENLVKISSRSAAPYSGASLRAAALSSTTPSTNGRYFSTALWNSPLLLTKANLDSATDYTPVGTFTAPDWILVARDGSNPTAWGTALRTSAGESASVVGRYAYAIYNEGGLLDANVAGYPSVLPSAVPASATSVLQQMGYKSALSYADLTELGLSQAKIDQIVGWRNNATALASGSLAQGYSFPDPSSTADHYLALSLQNSNQFITAENLAVNSNGWTDNRFISRQQLIRFLLNGIASSSADKASLQNILPYLGTFSRALNQPSVWPDPNRPKITSSAASINASSYTYSGGNSAYGADDTYNPPFRKVRVQSAFTRNDGTSSVVGEPLVKKRFALNRIAWVTCKGPSAGLSSNDPVIKQSIAQGIPLDLLNEGTAANIKKYFGLTWTASAGTGGLGGYWQYDHGITSAVGTLDQIAAANREPDFFELLEAGICAGSLAKGWTGIGNDTGYYGSCSQMKSDTRVDSQILQIGANIIDEFDSDSYPTQIIFNEGVLNRSVWGKENLPYLSGIAYTGFVAAAANPAPPTDRKKTTAVLSNKGLQIIMDVPVVWNPYNSSGSSVSALTPSNLRIVVSSAQQDGYTTAGRFTTTGTYADGGPTKSIDCAWNIGSYDTATGTVKMPTSGSNTALYFSNSSSLYRDPTPLLQPGIPSGSNLSIDSNNVMVLSGSFAWTGGVPEYNTGKKYLGFYAAQFPECTTSSGTTYTIAKASFAINSYPLTFSLEYQDGASWIPYMQYGALTRRITTYDLPFSQDANPDLFTWWPTYSQSSTWDPRTSRWGMPFDVVLTSGFLDTDKTMISSIRPTGAAVPLSHSSMGSSGWYNANGTSTGSFYIGSVCQNLYKTSVPYFYHKDADGIVRRGMAGGNATFDATSSAIAIPLATVYSTAGNLQNRPVMLNRPFRSVAELGYAFSDTPWKNLDFYIPESGDGALLDIFCINDGRRLDALMAGKVDLNTQQPKVLQAILSGAYRDELGVNSALATSEAQTVSAALISRTKSSVASKGPIVNLSDLVGRYVAGYSNSNGQPYAGFSEEFESAPYSDGSTSGNNMVQRFRETAVRALAANGMAGTWNLLIDVIAQTGRYSQNAKVLTDFSVEAERRYWVHVAIDRQTGEIIDKQIEPVNP